MTALTFLLIIIAGTMIGRALDDILATTVTRIRDQRAQRARARALAESFLASNRHTVFVTDCGCKQPTCAAKTIATSNPDGTTTSTSISLPPIGAELEAARALRGIATGTGTPGRLIPDTAREPALAVAEFLEHMAGRKGARS